MMEYGMIVGLIAIFVVAVLIYLAPPLRELYTDAMNPSGMGQAQASVSAATY